jgi:hypothetical protein
LGLASVAYAKDPKPYETGKLVQMESVRCSAVEKNDEKSFSGEVMSTGTDTGKSPKFFCQEYVLQSDKTTFHIRPRDEKHPLLLQIGDRAQFRMRKDKMLLHTDGKDRPYIVISMTPRIDSNAADATVPLLNHLQ